MRNGVRSDGGRRRAGIVAGAAALSLCGATGAVRAQAPERVALAGPQVEIHNLAGEVRLEPGSGSEVTVTVTRGGADADQLRIERRTFGDAQVLVVHYPADRIVYPRGEGRSESRFRVSEDGRLYDGGRRVTVATHGRGLEAYADLVVSVPAGTALALHHGLGEVIASGLQADLRIDVSTGPVRTSDTRGLLVIDTGSGSVEVAGHEGDLGVDTGSGSVRVREASGDQVSVDTGSGSVTIGGVEASQLHVDTGSGSIELGAVRASDVLLDTGSGGVEVELLERVDHLEVDTGSGGVVVYFPSDIGAEVEVETGSGHIDIDFPITVRVAERSHLVGTIGDGRGRVVIDTGSGSVRLRRR